MRVITSPADLGAAIREERKRKGLTQLELAQYCGVGLNFVSCVERGKETAEIGKVMRLCQMLGIEIIAERRGAWRKSSRYIELGQGGSGL